MPPCDTNGDGEEWLLRPTARTAQPWVHQLQSWHEQCPGDWLSWLCVARLNNTVAGSSDDADQAIQHRNVEARCGIQVVDLRSGDAVHWIRFEGLIEELYDVITLPGARNPSLVGIRTDEIRHLISIEE